MRFVVLLEAVGLVDSFFSQEKGLFPFRPPLHSRRRYVTVVVGLNKISEFFQLTEMLTSATGLSTCCHMLSLGPPPGDFQKSSQKVWVTIIDLIGIIW